MRNVMCRHAVTLLLAGLVAASVREFAWAEDIVTALPDISGPAVLLTDTVLPPGGTVLRTTAGWHVYGEIEGVAYRYSETEPTILFVANRRGVSKFMLAKDLAWRITCYEVPGRAPNCAVQAPPRDIFDDGVATIGDTVCLMYPRSVVLIPKPASVSTSTRDGRICAAVEQPERILNDFNAGLPTIGGLSGYGYPEARALRDWIIERYKSGDLGIR